MLLALLLAQLAGGPVPNPGGPIYASPSTMGAGAAFEAFPASGRGVTAACSTTAPTGTKGEAISCPRASTATCTKTATGGLATTGIANGDLVVLSSNVCRVEYDSGGVLGLLTEITRTNTALRSQELDNAVWTTTVSGVAAPTITANFATAPDGSLTAERIQLPATSGGQYSLVQQAAVFSAGTVSACLYVRGNGTSGQICISPGSSNGVSCLCPYVSTAWNLCKCQNKTLAGSDFFYVGNYSGAGLGGACQGVSFGAADVLAWGAQGEGGVTCTSYIPTTSAAVTRSSEVPTIGPSNFGITGNTASASVYTTTTSTSSGVPLLTFTGGQGVFEFFTSTLFGAYHYPTGSTLNDGAMSVGTLYKLSAYSDGAGTRGACVNGACTTGAASVSAFSGAPWTTYIGSEAGAGQFSNSIVSRICIDPSPTRCR